MEETITRWWLVGILVAVGIVLIGVIVPGLVSMHNDGALILAPILVGGYCTAVYVCYKKVLFIEKEDEE